MLLSMQKKIVLLVALITMVALVHTSTRAMANMVIDSLDGPITQNEIDSFKSYIQHLEPVVWPNTERLQTEYAQGKTGENIKAMGLMYELTRDIDILNRMIYFTDVVLSQRNDILPAPYGQRTVWTNTIAPVWPGNSTGIAAADSANADPVGHLANSAKLILQTPSIWNTIVPDGDPYGNGATYKERATKFLAEADYVADEFIFKHLLDLSNDNKYYFSTESPYFTGAMMPWNQQMMISYGLLNLAQAHELLGDNPTLVAQYDAIIQANLDWFFKEDTAKRIFTTSAGNLAYFWGYLPDLSTREDNSHGSLDVAGFYRAYLSGRYDITAEELKPFANTFVDIMMRGLTDFAGRVDGTDGTGNSSPTNYARSGYIYLTALRPDKYYDITYANSLRAGTSLDSFSRLMWAKQERFKDGYSIKFSPAPSPLTSAQTISLSTHLSGASIRYTTDGSVPTPTSGTLYTGPFYVSEPTTVKAIAYTAETLSPVSIGKYTVTPPAPSNLSAVAVSSNQIDLSWTAVNVGGVTHTYDVYRDDELIGSTSATSYSDIELTASTAYTYKVKAKDAASNASEFSFAVNATTFSDSVLGIDQLSYILDSGDLTINLQLNGDTLASIHDSARALVRGMDFTDNTASVALHASYLNQLTAGSYTLTFAFGSGKTETLTLIVVQGSLALNKTYFASSSWSAAFDGKYAFDDSDATRWSAGRGQVSDQYVGVNFGNQISFNKVVLKEISFPRVNSFILQYSEDGVNYYDIPGTEGTTIGALQTVTFETVSAQYLRLWINSTKLESGASKEPTINEFEVYNVDITKPVTHAEVISPGSNGANGWYVQPVTLQLTGEDELSGVDIIEYSMDGTTWQSYRGPITFAHDGRYTVSYRSTDKAGNQEQSQMYSFNLDMTSPVITVSMPADGSSYPISGDLVPQFTATDMLSGVNDSTTVIMLNGRPIENGAVVPIYTLPLGVNTVQVSTSDLAGNVQSVTVTFSTYADLESLKMLVSRFTSTNEIDNAGIANSLLVKLSKGNLQAFIHEVKAQSGKHISNEAAYYLQKFSQAILDNTVANNVNDIWLEQ